MRDHPPVSDELLDEMHRLVTASLNGTLSPAEEQRLEQLIEQDLDACDLYLNLVNEWSMMLTWAGHDRSAGTAVGEGTTRPMQQTPRGEERPSKDERRTGVPAFAFRGTETHLGVGQFSSGWPLAYLVATVIFGIGLVIGALTHVSQPGQIGLDRPLPSDDAARLSDRLAADVVGRITGMIDCQWANPRTAAVDGASVPLGRKYVLDSGSLEITYDTGAKVILQGPVTYEVESSMGGYLAVGRLTAKLENRSEIRGQRSESANPKSEIPNHKSLSPIPRPLFSVRTPTAMVTDLGTEFGVEVDKEGTTQVHVLEGLVEARGTGPYVSATSAERLSAGSAVAIGQKGVGMKAVDFAPQSFLRKLPRAADNTADNRAEDAYIEAVLADGPMGYWPLNEPAGSRKFADRSGHGIHGFAMREVKAGQPGPFAGSSRAIALRGGGYIDFGSRDEFAMANNFTVEAWVWIGDVKDSGYAISAIGRHESGAHIGWGFHAGRPRVKGKPADEAPIALSFCAPPDTADVLYRGDAAELGQRWLHVAVTYDGDNTLRLYVNGEVFRTFERKRPAILGPVWLQIGGAEQVDEDFWRGRLAHVAVYPHVLSDQQIRNHYQQSDRGGEEADGKQH
jgi:hypothetical protein